VDEPATDTTEARVVAFVKQMNVTAQAIVLYPGGSSFSAERASTLAVALREALDSRPLLTLGFNRDGIVFEESALLDGVPAMLRLGRAFYSRDVVEASFGASATAEDLRRLLVPLTMSPDAVRLAGGFGRLLREDGVTSVTVSEAGTLVSPAGEGAVRPLDEADSRSSSDEIDDATLGVPRLDAIRRLLAEPDRLAEYVGSRRWEDSEEPKDRWLATRVPSIARAVGGLPEPECDTLMRSLAEAVFALTAEDRRTLLVDRLLVASSTDENLARLVTHMKLDEISAVVAEGVLEVETWADPSREAARCGLARAIHNLVRLGVYERAAVESAVVEALGYGSAAETKVQDVFSKAWPTRVDAGRAECRQTDSAMATVMKMVALASSLPPLDVEEEALVGLRTEAAAGVEDADILGVLIAIVAAERRPEPFAQAVGLVEEGIDALVASRRFDVVETAAATLAAVRNDETRPREQTTRLCAIFDGLMGRETAAMVATAMRFYPTKSREFESCRRFLALMARESVESVVEAMALETNMVARKALVNALDESAGRLVEPLTAHMNDPRWYVVRNIVSILGQAHDPAVLPTMRRALRHPEPRVRREAIRSLALVPHGEGAELLARALRDEDVVNCELATRLIGPLRYLPAVPSLTWVARGDRQVKHPIELRIAAIEALGQIGAPESLALLDALARLRRLRALRRTRQVVPAAQRAAETIRANTRHDGVPRMSRPTPGSGADIGAPAAEAVR